MTTDGPVRNLEGLDLSRMLDREWLVTNGLGGFATGTICGASTRRYHGMLVAAHPSPLGRLMMFNHLTEQFRFPDFTTAKFGGVEKAGSKLEVHGADMLTDFRLVAGLPVWRFEAHGHVIEKQLFMPYQHNTVHIIYRLVSGPGSVRLKLRPSVHFRDYDAAVNVPMKGVYSLTAIEGLYELKEEGLVNYPQLRLKIDGDGAALTLEELEQPDVLYRVEENRGYEGIGTLYSPGQFRINLQAGRDVTLSASTEPWDRFLAIPPAAALEFEQARRRKLVSLAHPSLREGFGAEMVLAADQFVITPVSRSADIARAQASGDTARTVIAGYHWFTDWGRDTMISLEGLTLVTGRHFEARNILRTFASHVRNGLIPNYFPDGANKGVYHTADATLWFFHALSRYVDTTNDRDTLRSLLPILLDIVAHHEKGTDFGIGVDPADGLLKQGAEGYQLTWMDAKVDGWVVTPRRGKAVEINALWFNALTLLAGWLRQEKQDDDHIQTMADRAKASFNERFWNPTTGYLFDVVDQEVGGNDPACRPNQVFAISLPNPVLDPSRWAAVMDVAEKRLFTPVGLRSLAPGEPEYKSKYYGDLRSRDAAYHQGTVWGWLIGPFVDAWKKTNPTRTADAGRWLAGFDSHLSEACVGSISEVFDAEEPYTARACIARAWSGAEVARCLAKS